MGNYICLDHGRWLPTRFADASAPATSSEVEAQLRLIELFAGGLAPCTWSAASALLTTLGKWSLESAIEVTCALLEDRTWGAGTHVADLIELALNYEETPTQHLGSRLRQLRHVPHPPEGSWDELTNGPEPQAAPNQKVVAWRCFRGHQFWARPVEVRTWGAGCVTCRAIERFGRSVNHAPQLGSIGEELISPIAAAAAALGPWSQKKVLWLCGAGHEYSASPSDRYRGSGCPVCRGRVVMPGYNDLVTLAPKAALDWDAAANNGLLPNAVLAGESRKRWWRCPRGHSYLESPKRRSIRNSGCKVCAGREVQPGVNDLGSLRPGLSKRLVDPGQARNVPVSGRDVLEWTCLVGHKYLMPVHQVTRSELHCPTCVVARRRKTDSP